MNPPGQKYQRGVLASVVDSNMTDIVLFQYNPESIKRTLRPQFTGYENGGGEGGTQQSPADIAFKDAAAQSISFTAYFDAADALQDSDETALSYGIAPQLAILEKLMYPTVSAVQSTEQAREQGQMTIVTMEPPGTILVWGQNRVLPVRIKSVDITEEAFDVALNPLRANAVIGVEVQTYSTRKPSDLDYGRFAAYHRKLEDLAAKANVSGTTRSNLQSMLNR
ncbi:MAG: hypothetical protein JO103_06380 [Candidatus Eremiobacteraeota bacterium]|nr:hypothetical protein [Candidatus Eremiobacteraeota bacterium]MBV9407548.1 hypothetical protein [Candidatus Eremiobacteraeota bacterium]